MKQQELAGIAPAPVAVKSKRKTYVEAPTKCDACRGPFNGHLYNAKTTYGLWGNICEKCFRDFGCGLGTGLGQRYVLEADGWIKVAG